MHKLGLTFLALNKNPCFCPWWMKVSGAVQCAGESKILCHCHYKDRYRTRNISWRGMGKVKGRWRNRAIVLLKPRDHNNSHIHPSVKCRCREGVVSLGWKEKKFTPGCAFLLLIYFLCIRNISIDIHLLIHILTIYLDSNINFISATIYWLLLEYSNWEIGDCDWYPLSMQIQMNEPSSDLLLKSI